MIRRRLPELVVGLLLIILLSSFVILTRRVVEDLQVEALRSSQRYARVFRAQSEGSERPLKRRQRLRYPLHAA